MTVLDKLRTAVPPAARERLYVIAAAAVTLLASWGTIDMLEVPAWTALAVSVITLVFATLHSTSTVRTALYSVLLAVQGVAQIYGILSDVQWASIAGLVAAVLGISVAAAKTPTPITASGITAAIDQTTPGAVRAGAFDGTHVDTNDSPAARGGPAN